MSLARTRDFLELVKFSHTLFALPFALLGAALAACTRTAGTAAAAGLARASCSAWRRPGRPRWPSTAWPTATTTPSTPGPPAGTSRRAGSRVRSVRALHGGLRPRPSSPRRSCSCRTAGRSSSRSRSCSGSWATRTPSGSPAWPISGSGLSLSLAPVAAWIALRGDLAWPPVLLAVAVLFWVSGFDIIYACQDVDFDRQRRPAAASRGRLGSPRGPAARGRLPRPDDRPLWSCSALIYPLGIDLLRRGRGRRRAAGLRARPGPSRRPDPGQPRLLPGERRHQHRPAGRRRRRPAVLTRAQPRLMIAFNSATDESLSVVTKISVSRCRNGRQHRTHVRGKVERCRPTARVMESIREKVEAGAAAELRGRPGAGGDRTTCSRSARWPTWCASGTTATSAITTSTRTSTRRTSASTPATSARSGPTWTRPGPT